MESPCLLVSTDKKGRETSELSRGCALPDSRRERKRTNKRFAVLAAALGKSISGPPENLLCPRDRTVLQPVPTEAQGPVIAKPVCLVPSIWPLECNSGAEASKAPDRCHTLWQPAPSGARTLEAGKRWARLARARAASRPGLWATAPGRRAGAPPLCTQSSYDPMDRSMPGFPVLHHLPEFAQTHKGSPLFRPEGRDGP